MRPAITFFNIQLSNSRASPSGAGSFHIIKDHYHITCCGENKEKNYADGIKMIFFVGKVYFLSNSFYIYRKKRYNPIFDSQIYQNTAESLILPGFFSGVFSFYYIVFFLNQIWMIDFYDFSRDCLLSFWISFIFLLVRNS